MYLNVNICNIMCKFLDEFALFFVYRIFFENFKKTIDIHLFDSYNNGHNSRFRW